ncbi:SMI1/KNR4 family protein [Bradyrhizobium diazoefficiens]|uniref:SMI1/KNR4 family protein n=1 Tax=Bradyrhizobium diazoefficiens TaxID=1355477 RepID=UPI001909A41A|nr:SMI1/KNR4 family protein [Bradyrhizobium diazoefficiens]MBK3665188.1 SMI1/KNR4 family protein [Bradyrhizobium diazoefficiens]
MDTGSPEEEASKVLAKFDCRPPTSSASIANYESGSGWLLPDDYKQFLGTANGGQGTIGTHSYASLWPVEHLDEMNRAYETANLAPGLLLFGSDGGDEAYAFDMRVAAKPVVSVPFVGMDLNEIRPVADTFEGFLKKLSEIAA